MNDDSFEAAYGSLIRMAEQVERMGECGGVVRVDLKFTDKHGGGEMPDAEPQVYDALQLLWELREATRRVRDAQGFRAMLREIIRGEDIDG